MCLVRVLVGSLSRTNPRPMVVGDPRLDGSVHSEQKESTR